MHKFTCAADIGDLRTAVAEALEIKRDRYQFTGLGRNKTLLMLFFNSSLRTRLSTQKAAMNLGMNVMVLDVNQGAWKLETERGVVMDGDKAEHLLEAIPVMGSYCDVIGVRSFAKFNDKAEDYEERVLEQFIRYSGRPVFSMEAATRHPLQSLRRPDHDRRVQDQGASQGGHDVGPAPQRTAAGRAQLVRRVDERRGLRLRHHPPRRIRALRRSSSAARASNTTSARRSKEPTSSMPRTGRPTPIPTTARSSAATAHGPSTPKRWRSRTTHSSCTACPCGAT